MQTQTRGRSVTTGARKSGADAFDDLEDRAGINIIPHSQRYLLRPRTERPSTTSKIQTPSGTIKYSLMNLDNSSQKLQVDSTPIRDVSLLDTDLPEEVEELLPEPFELISDKVLRQQNAANHRRQAYQVEAQTGNVSGFDNDYQGACAFPSQPADQPVVRFSSTSSHHQMREMMADFQHRLKVSEDERTRL